MVNIDRERFEKLCELQCEVEDIANYFDCEVEDLKEWVKDEYGEEYDVIYEKKSIKGKVQIREAQFKLAEKNVSMAIWLGRQYLGQTEDQSIVSAVDKSDIADLRAKFNIV